LGNNSPNARISRERDGNFAASDLSEGPIVDHRVLVIGSRRHCERHGRALRATERARVAWVITGADSEAERAEFTVFNRLEAARSFMPTAAVVATDASTRVETAVEALLTGLHVLVDAPLSVSLDGVDALRQQAQMRPLIVAVGYPDRDHPLFQVLREALREQRFGPPLQMTACRGAPLPIECPDFAQSDFADHSRGGGAIQQSLTHLINLGEWLIGPVDRLMADADRLSLDGVSVEDSVHVLARHGRIMAAYLVNLHQLPAETVITVHCAAGTIRAELPENRLRWFTEADGKWSEQMFDPLDQAALEVEQAHQFLNAIEGLPARLCTLDQAIQTLRVNRAVIGSVQHRVWEARELPEA
jgi:predicted dehydrogenase